MSLLGRVDICGTKLQRKYQHALVNLSVSCTKYECLDHKKAPEISEALNLLSVRAINWLNRQTHEAKDYWNRLDSELKRQTKVNMLYKYIEDNPELFNEARKSLFYKPSLASDGFFPFSDNIECANKYGVKFIVQPGGSINDEEVQKSCDKYGIKMVLSGASNRMFFH